MKEQMQELYVEGLASHNGPGHAGVIARSRLKRCSRVRAGEVSSLETFVRDADPVCVVEGNTAMRVMRACGFGPAGSLDPQHVRKPSCTRTGRALGRWRSS
jgi:hypothetical protein